MKEEFEMKRTELAGYFADSGAALLAYMATDAALAAIPSTDPQQYVVAGTLQMIAKVLPAVPPVSAAEQPSVDNYVFRELLWAFQRNSGDVSRISALIAHIDSHLARQSPAPEKEERPLIPKGWRIAQHADGAIVAQKEGLGGVVLDSAYNGDEIAAAMFEAFLKDLLAEAFAPVAQEVEPGNAPAAADEVRDGWISVDERLPEAKQIVLLKSENWEFPAVLKYQELPFQRFLDEVNGRWYWYPERMHWMRLPPAPEVKTTASASTSADGGAA